jgi:DNA-binding XRE family transcriptional regulator
MGEPKFTRTSDGEEIVILSREDYEDLRDAADAASAKAALARGEEELLTREETRELLEAPTPLYFWRRKRNFTQEMLAEALGISQGFILDLENGRTCGDFGFYQRLAWALHVPVGAILPPSEEDRDTKLAEQ